MKRDSLFYFIYTVYSFLYVLLYCASMFIQIYFSFYQSGQENTGVSLYSSSSSRDLCILLWPFSNEIYFGVKRIGALGKCEEGCDITAKRTKRSIAFCYSTNRKRGRFFLLLTSQQFVLSSPQSGVSYIQKKKRLLVDGWYPTWSIVPHYWNDTHTHKLDDDDGDGGVRWRILLRVVFLFVVVLDGPQRRTDHVPRVRQTEPTIFEQIFSFQKKPKDINFTSTHHRLRRRFGVY